MADKADYDELLDYLEEKMKVEHFAPSYSTYGVVLSGLEGFTFVPDSSVGNWEIELDEKQINHGESWAEGFRAST